MKIHLGGKGPHQVKLSYVTETPAWKPSYRIMLSKDGKVDVRAWAIVDNTSGEDWNNVKLGVGSSSALSFRFDLRSVRFVQRETLQSNDLFAQAPPMGGSTYGQSPEKRVLGELTDGAIAANEAVDELRKAPAPVTSVARVKPGAAPKSHRAEEPSPDMAGGVGLGAGRGAGAQGSDVSRMAQALKSSNRQIVIEGYADKNDKDKFAASLDRANKVRDQLLKNGVNPSQVVALGQGEQAGRAGGVRLVEAPPPPPAQAAQPGGQCDTGRSANPRSDRNVALRITSAMAVAKGSSAMVSILDTKTDGEVVYLYDAESPRGNAGFPFKAVRLKNPTDSALESGPVTVFGEGRFIGEGLSEPIPARSVAFVPFALDRQIVVERKEDEPRQHLAHPHGAARRVLQRSAAHPALHLRAPQPHGRGRHRLRSAHRRRRLQAHQRHQGRAASASALRTSFGLPFRPASPPSWWSRRRRRIFKTIDLRSPGDMEQVRLYLSAGVMEGTLKGADRRAHQDAARRSATSSNAS